VSTDIILKAAAVNLRAELDNGPDAQRPVPHGCPACGDDLFYDQIILWRYYPDMNHYEVWCEGCSLWMEVDL
jgi:hypothetical protein